MRWVTHIDVTSSSHCRPCVVNIPKSTLPCLPDRIILQFRPFFFCPQPPSVLQPSITFLMRMMMYFSAQNSYEIEREKGKKQAANVVYPRVCTINCTSRKKLCVSASLKFGTPPPPGTQNRTVRLVGSIQNSRFRGAVNKRGHSGYLIFLGRVIRII